MTSLLKWILGIALGLAMSGHLKSATLRIAELVADAKRHQLSYGKFSLMLTTPSNKRQK